MKKAVLYARVSTDEQADRGYSLELQQEQLRKYCEIKGIEIVKLYVEDHSAKNFDRPEFNNFLMYAKSNHSNIDYLLFVAWDRFSRNAPDAYEMLRKLKKWNIEPQAISQPLDWAVPESKIMLSLYLSLPEVDNDNRSKRATLGMRKARLAGRWTGIAPLGYKNSRDGQNKPLLVLDEKSKWIKWVFEEIAKGERNLNNIRLELNTHGFNVTSSNMSLLVRNPVYFGKVLVKATSDEPETLADGVHEPLITEELFDKVQLILSGRIKQRKNQFKTMDRDELPLRGLLVCSKCGNHVTGSASRSRNGERHFYYFCMCCKKERFRAEVANKEMETLLSALQINEGVENLYRKLIETGLRGNPNQQGQEKSVIQRELNKLNERKSELQETFLDGHLSAQDYTELKNKLEGKIAEIKVQLSNFEEAKDSFQDQLNEKLLILTNLLQWYRNKGIKEKKQLLGSIFPEKLKFEQNQIRTEKINPVMALILSKTGQFSPKKKAQNRYFSILGLIVRMTGLEPAHP
jgi:site-specific DNA recombinase